MQKLKNNNVVPSLFVVLGLAYFAWVIFQNKAVLFKRYDPIQAEKKYGQSQWQQSQNISVDKVLDEWALKNGNTGWKNYVDENRLKVNIQAQKEKIVKDIQNKGVSDSFLYSYVGYRYINGEDPSLLNPEHPPLAKYLIGYSIRVFGNEHYIGIGIGLIILLLVAVISYQIHESFLAASMALFLTSLFPLFTDQITHGPQLELYQLFFFLLVIHMLLMWMKKKKIAFCVFAGLFFGMLLSTKTVLPFFLLFSVWIILSFLKQWKVALMVISIGTITFVATYYRYFILGGTVRSFLGVQKYIVLYYGNSHIPLFEFAGNYLRLIFTGSWKFWDAARTVSLYSEWNILWPLIFIIGISRLHMQWKRHSNSHLLIYFFILYNIFVFFVPVFPRYLLLLFVPLIILI